MVSCWTLYCHYTLQLHHSKQLAVEQCSIHSARWLTDELSKLYLMFQKGKMHLERQGRRKVTQGPLSSWYKDTNTMSRFTYSLINHWLSPYCMLDIGEAQSSESWFLGLEEKKGKDVCSTDCLLWAGIGARRFIFNPSNNPLEICILIPVLEIKGLTLGNPRGLPKDHTRQKVEGLRLWVPPPFYYASI